MSTLLEIMDEALDKSQLLITKAIEKLDLNAIQETRKILLQIRGILDIEESQKEKVIKVGSEVDAIIKGSCFRGKIVRERGNFFTIFMYAGPNKFQELSTIHRDQII